MTKEEAQLLLVQKHAETGRMPAKADFTPEEASAVKAALGNWPRALEAAGLKPPKENTRHARTVEKRRARKIAARTPLPKEKKGSKTS